jgi:hypothetical protein
MLLYSASEIAERKEKNVTVAGQGIVIFNASRYIVQIANRDNFYYIQPFMYISLPVNGEMIINLMDSNIDVNIDNNEFVILYTLDRFKPINRSLSIPPIYTYKGKMPV